MRHSWLVVVTAISCGSPQPTGMVARTDATTQVGDPPEPVAPAMDCDVKLRPAYCRGGFPVLSAYQPAPFSSCPKTLPAEAGVLGSSGKLFSAAETRKLWASGTHDCCYLEWTWTACD
ncbi:MAG TPA: hypothetical protein VGF94_22875 [Kofleriaceae bacterium]|jgi:hypothetical protein